MHRATLADELAPFTPEFIRRRLAVDPRPLAAPLLERWHGAALVADISGFTPLAERLAAEGSYGAERLTEILDGYFGRAVACIAAHGGDVARFAGDALLVVWPCDAASQIAGEVRRAAACALDLQDELAAASTPEEESLSIKVGLGVGSLAALHVGGFQDRWDFLISGVAFQQAFAALRQTAAGETVASIQAWNFLQSEFRGQPRTGGVVRLAEGPRTPQGPPALPIPIHEAMLDALRSYLPATVIERLSAGHEQWLGELRMATVLFASLPELNYATPLDHVQNVMQYLQRELFRYEGAVNKLNVDDKGASLLAAFGLPPLAHDDDARRAVAAALSLQSRLRELGLDCSLGVSTGRVFCGAFGGDRRREYTILGDVVNRAARLMQTAVGDLLCDEETQQAAERHFRFEPLPEVMLKGKAAALKLFRPVAPRGRQTAARAELVGRDRERRQLLDELKLARASHAARLLEVEGEPGVGKTRFLAECLRLAQGEGAATLAGHGDSLERGTLYYAWRPIFERLFGIDASTSAAEAQARLTARMQDAAELAAWSPLLRALLPMDLPDNDLTAHMSGRVRGENTRRLLAALLEAEARRRPVVIALDDAHDLDSASVELVEATSRIPAPVLMIVGVRPTPSREMLAALLAAAPHRLVRLGPLGEEDATLLACRRLGVASLPPRAADFIHRRAEGNPLFIEEMAAALRDAGQLEIVEGKCRLRDGGLGLDSLDVPDTLHGVMTSRLDRLAPAEQLTVKVASVIGRRFPYRALHAIYPVEPDRPQLRDYLASAQRTQIVDLERPEPELSYYFRSAIAREAAYQLLLFHQREQLHRAVAQWRESAEKVVSPRAFAALAYHWRHARQPARAVDYLEQAGEAALRGGAYQEAISFFWDALELDDAANLANSAVRLAFWERRLGEAFLGLGRLAESREHLLMSLSLYDHPAPRSAWGQTLGLSKQLIAQAACLGRQPLAETRETAHTGAANGETWRPDVSRRQVALEIARCYESLAEIYYLANEKLPLVHALVANLRFARQAGPSPELARAYANNCISAGFAGLHALARRYARRAKAIGRQVNDPAALAWVLEVTSLYALGVGAARDVQDDLREAASLCRKLGDWRRWGENLATLGQGAYYGGDIAQGWEAWNELRQTAAQRGDELQQAWGLNGCADGLLRRNAPGAADAAREHLLLAHSLYARNVDRISQLGSWGLLAWSNGCRHDLPAAREAVTAGLRLAEEIGSPTGHYSLAGYANLARASVWLCEHGAASDARQHALLLAQSLRGLDRYARAFPIGRPVAHLWRGASHWLQGRRRRAVRDWRKAIALAQSLHMPYEEALAHQELATRLPAGDVRRAEHQQAAQDLWRRMGVDVEPARPH